MTRKRPVCVLGLVVALLMSSGCWDRSGHKSRLASEAETLDQLYATTDDPELRARAQLAQSRLLNNKTEETPYIVAAAVVRTKDSNRIYLVARYVTEVYAGGCLEITSKRERVNINIGEVAPLKEVDRACRTILISEEQWGKASSVPLRELKNAELRIRVRSHLSSPILIRVLE